ncbi:unnamed protein product, partial [Meganyctiphanes norvegica]
RSRRCIVDDFVTTMDLLRNNNDIYSLRESLQRSARDSGGYGGGGCGGFEVFGFLAFLLALLDLFLEINDMDDMMGGGTGTGRRKRSDEMDVDIINQVECKVPLDISSGWWSVGEVGSSVLAAVRDYQECSPGYPCPAAVSLCHNLADIAKAGPLPRSVVKLTSKWMSKWPSLQGSQLAKYSRRAAKGRICSKLQRKANNKTMSQAPVV